MLALCIECPAAAVLPLSTIKMQDKHETGEHINNDRARKGKEASVRTAGHRNSDTFRTGIINRTHTHTHSCTDREKKKPLNIGSKSLFWSDCSSCFHLAPLSSALHSVYMYTPLSLCLFLSTQSSFFFRVL